ncbi:MAG: ABC transporter substrate-binding protein [Actinomycetota bacterium]
MKRTIIFSLVMSTVIAACGLQVPMTDATGSFGQGGAPVGPEDFGDAQPGLGGDTSGTDTGSGGTVNLPGGTDTGSSGGSGDTGSSGGNSNSGGAVKSSGLFANETEGINNDQITICAHVPISGAAPLARHQDRFGQFYFNYVNKELGGIYGRKVRFLAYDDQYNPTGARAAFERCRREGAFIYVGAAGTDQIVSVAKLAEQYKIPYLHGPTSDKDLKTHKYNIHAAPTYEAQHRYLARYLVGRYGKDVKYGMVRVASVFFEAGHDAFVDELKKLGVTLAVDREVQKDETSFSAVIQDLRANNVQVVNNFTTPSIWLKMIPQAQGYRPTWTAVSPIAGYNLVANTLGPSAKAVVFQHFNPGCNCTKFEGGQDPSLPYADHIRRFVQIFKKYSPEQKPEIDDFDYGAFISAEFLHRLLLALGPNPTRSGLFNLVSKYKEDQAEVAPGCAADFTRGGRRGGHNVNVLELSGGKWKQVQSCVDVGN